MGDDTHLAFVKSWIDVAGQRWRFCRPNAKATSNARVVATAFHWHCVKADTVGRQPSGQVEPVRLKPVVSGWETGRSTVF